MKKKTIIFSIVALSVLVGAMTGYAKSAYAYTWPGSKWGPPIKIDLANNDKHDDKTKTSFGVYFDNDTTKTNSSFTIFIDHEVAVCSGGYTVTRANGKSVTKTCGDDDTSVSIQYDGTSDDGKKFNGVYISEINKTRYEVAVSIPKTAANTRLRFNVFTPEVSPGNPVIGFMGYNNLFGILNQTPFSIDGSDKNQWSNVSIKIRDKCDQSNGLNQPFTFYDLDNYAPPNKNNIADPDGAQDNGKGILRWVNGKAEVNPNLYEFRYLQFGLERDMDNKIKNYEGNGWMTAGQWEKTANNFAIPKDYGSENYGGLFYNFVNKNRAFTMHFNDLNNDNYLAFSSPYDEFIKYCDVPQPKPNWLLTSKSKVDDVDKKTIFAGSTVAFKHWVWDTGVDPVEDTTISVELGGVGGALGDSYENQIVGEAAAWYKSRSVTISNVGDDQCDTVKYSPQKMVEGIVSGDGSGKACVHAIDPESVVSTKAQYEKGSNSIEGITSKIDVDDGKVCPTQAINIPYKWTIKYKSTGTIIDKSSALSFDYGNGNCNNKPDNIITLNNDLKSLLNDKSPGPSDIQYCVNVNEEGDKCGDIEVFEVPFARFYGNDIYATREDATGEIRFNDATSDPDYNGKGSASQYAALAFGAVKIDTAAYRHPDYYASFNANAAITSTLPPNGLDAANSKFGARSATDEYNKVVANIPNNCTAFPGNLNVATGCYTATGETTINATNYSNKVTLKAETVVIKGNNVVVPPPPPPAPDPPAPQPDPKPRDDGLNVVTISTIDSNRRSYERTFDVGSYYSVDKLFGSTGVRCGEYIFSPCIRDITFRKPGYKVTFVGSRFLGGEVTVTNNFNYRSITGDRTFLSWQAANQRYIQYFKVESTAPAAVTNRVSPMAPTPAAEAAFVGDPPEAGPLDGADPNLPTGIALIVADNIYIDKSVERIDAILVAKNAIYTCTEGAAQIPNADLENTNKCRKTLTVNGAISAPTIKFQRVGGSRYLNNPRSADDKETCHISHGIQNCDARGDIANDSGKTAEVINFPAYLYFTSPYLKNNTDPGTPRLDNMFTAPPRQ